MVIQSWTSRHDRSHQIAKWSQIVHLNVTSVGGVAVAIGALGSTSAISKSDGGGFLLATPRAEPVLLVLGLGTHLDFTGGGVAG